MERQNQFAIWYLIIAVLGVFFLRDVWIAKTQVETIPYSEFERALKAGQIKEGARRLLQKETLVEDELQELLGASQAPELAPS